MLGSQFHHGHVSSSRHVKRSGRISRTPLSCSLHPKGYETYRVGSAFGDSEPRRTRYPLNRPRLSESHRLLYLFHPKPRRFLARKGYETYRVGSAFGDSEPRRTRYPLNRPRLSESHRLLHLFHPKPRRFRARKGYETNRVG